SSWSFSRSKSESVFSISDFSCLIRPLIASPSPAPFDDRRRVLVDDHLARAAQLRQGDVLEHALAAIAEARSLHRDSLEGAAQLVDHDRRERLALDILSHDQQVRRQVTLVELHALGELELEAERLALLDVHD